MIILISLSVCPARSTPYWAASLKSQNPESIFMPNIVTAHSGLTRFLLQGLLLLVCYADVSAIEEAWNHLGKASGPFLMP